MEVLQCLMATQNEDKFVREQAEQRLSQLTKEPGFGVILSKTLVDESVPIDFRQLAGIILKRYVRNHWEPPLDMVPSVCRVPENDREVIKNLLPQALQAPSTKIRIAAAMAIASIAHWDWPIKWPGLIQSLLECLGSSNPNLVEGAICCLEIIASGENSSDQQLPGLITLSFPPLLQIVSNTFGQFDDRVKMRAIMVVSSCLEWLSVTKQVANTEVTIHTLAPMLPLWFAAFNHHLSTPDQPLQFFGLKIAILQTLLIIVHHFPAYIKNDMAKFLPKIWQALVNVYPFYDELAIKKDRLGEMQLRDGESASVVGLEPYVAILFEVFHALAYKAKFRSLLQPLLPQLFYLAIGYMQMTEEQILNYDSDPNQWVADEEDETLEVSVRISTTKLIQELFHGYKTEAHKPFSEAISKRLEESNGAFQSGDKKWWKLRETVIYSIGMAADDLIQNKTVLDLKGFSSSILVSDINTNLPFLKGRAMWCASIIGRTLNLEEVTPFLAVASNTLNSSSDPIPVKIFACRAVANFCPRLHAQVVGPYMDGLMGGLVGIIDHLSKETLYLLLETFHVLLPLSEDVARKYLVPIVARLLILWAHNYKDGVLVPYMIDIISDFAQFPSCNLLLQEKLSTTLVNLIKQNEKHQFTVIETTIDLATAIIMPGKSVIYPLLMNEFFPILCNILLTTNDSGILEGGINTLRAYIRNGGPLLIEWNSPSGENGLQFIVKIISRLLSPGIPDNAAISVGFLIDKFMTTYKQHIGGILDGLLSAVLARLHSCNDSTLQQGLLMVFVRLFMMDTEQSIAYLLSKGGTSELAFILREWTSQHTDFSGAFTIKMSIMGLCKVFQSSNAVLNGITVPGDLMPSHTGHKTRSKSKHVYAEEPLKLKIFKILIREHQVIQENEGDDSVSLSDSVDEAEWDEEEEDEEGSFVKRLVKAGSAAGQSCIEQNVLESLSDPFAAQATYAYLDELIGTEKIEREEKDDPDIIQDPIYGINLKEFIVSFLKAFASQEKNGFDRFAGSLLLMDKTSLDKII